MTSVLPNAKEDNIYALAVFFHIKIRQEDWKGYVCAPSKKIQKYWRKVLRFPREYQEMCRRFADGETLEYDWEKDDFQRSYLTTYLLAAPFYKNMDESIWPYPDLLKKPRFHLHFQKFHCMEETGTLIFFKQRHTMADLKRKLRKKLNLSDDHPILLFLNGESFIHEHTMAHTFDENSIIHWYCA